MNRTEGVVPIESLLEHRDWVRRLARALSRDESGADDLEQEVWLRAMRHPLVHAGSPRGWLGTVLRRLAVDRRRSEEGRARREGLEARREMPVPSPADLVAEAESHRRVVEAVLSLEEPNRSTVLLRWFEDLPPKELARRLGVPLETVRARLRRAGEQLRDRLGAKRGEGDAWKAVVLPLIGCEHPDPVPPWTGIPWKGAVIMGAKTTAAAATGAVLALGLGWWLLSSSATKPTSGPDGTDQATHAPRPAAPQGAGAVHSAAGESSSMIRQGRPAGEIAGSGSSSTTRVEKPPPAWFETGKDKVSGRVVDPSGRAGTGVPVRFLSLAKMIGPGEILPEPTRRAETDDHGRFWFDGLGDGDVYVCIRLDAPGYLKRETWVAPGSHGFELVLVPSKPLRGAVVDGGTGAGIGGMLVLVRPPNAGPMGPVFPARTGTDGGFALEDLPEGRYSVEVGDLGADPASPVAAYVRVRVDGVVAGTTDLRVVLSRGHSISGVILDATGKPVSIPVKVTALGKTDKGGPDYSRHRVQTVGKPDLGSALTGKHGTFDGTFSVPGLSPGNYDLSFAPEAGTGPDAAGPDPVTLTTVRDVPAGTEGLRVVMREGSPLTGLLVDDDGKPVAGGYVYVYPAGNPPGGSPISTVLSKEDGAFATVPMDEGREYEILVDCKGYMLVKVKGLYAGDPAAKVVLSRAEAISGIVQDEDGKPVGAGVPVSARGEGVDPMKPGSGMVAYTEYGGTFRLDGLGNLIFTLVAGGGETVHASGPPVKSVKAGTKDLVLRVKKGVVISGVLQDAEGRPLKTHHLGGSGLVSEGGVDSWTRVENDEGKFTLRGLPPGKVRLSCYVGDTYVQLGEFTAPAEGLVVKVPER